MDQIESIRAFAEVVDAGGFARAARRLGLSAARITRLVQALEERLDARLLERTTRTVRLTEIGHAYHQRCLRILEEMDEADAIARRDTVRPQGRLRVSAPVTFGTRRLGPLIPGYLARHPDVVLELSLTDRRVDLVNEGFDVALRIGRLEDSSLIAQRIAETRLVACASPGYLAASPPLRHPEDLRHHCCLRYSLATPRMGAWTFQRGEERVTVEVEGGYIANNGEVLTAAAEADGGIIVQPDFIVADALARGDLVEVLEDWRAGGFGVHALYPHRRHVPARVRSFLDFLAARWAASTRDAEGG